MERAGRSNERCGAGSAQHSVACGLEPRTAGRDCLCATRAHRQRSPGSERTEMRGVMIHPAWLRTTHWLNAVAVVILAMSGWRIYNAAPFFDFIIPSEITLARCPPAPIQLHFSPLWLPPPHRL